jgi:hypothetical protein
MPTAPKLKTVANAPAPKREKAHPLLTWVIEEDAGLLVIEPSCVNTDYANGDSDGHEITFHSFADARRQLFHLISELNEMEYNLDPYFCEHCLAKGVETKLPYEVTQTEDWDCPVCNCPNMGS